MHSVKMIAYLKFLLLCNLAYLTAAEDPVIEVPGLGMLRGRTSNSYFNRYPIYEYLGINYAKPPSGERRFQPPEVFDPWEGIYDATKMRQRCPQIDLPYYPPLEDVNATSDAEDCLVLNVFTRHGNKSDPSDMPVMFYIHGGSFCFGSAYDFHPNYLLDEDIVLVIPQYRLGVLGFLSLQNDAISGNFGMLDIVSALRWVKRHIRHFGGDPERVTVVGQSAGAAAASSLLISPLVEEGLFDKMIIQSGSVLAKWAFDNDPITPARKVAEYVNCNKSDLEEMAECLKKVPAVDLINAHSQYMVTDYALEGHRQGGASLVVQKPGENAFLVEHPKKSFANDRFLRVPVMAGTTRDEGTAFITAFYPNWLEENKTQGPYLDRNITKDLLKDCGFDDADSALIDIVQNTYFRNVGSLTIADMIPGLIDIIGALLLKEPTYNVLRYLSHSTDAYAYSFNFKGNVSRLRAFEPDWEVKYPFESGVTHSDELGYLFQWTFSMYDEREIAQVQVMTKLWSNFIRTGSPEGEGSEFKWPKMTGAYGPYLRISDRLTVRDNYFDEFTIISREGFLPNGESSTAATIPLLTLLPLLLFEIK